MRGPAGSESLQTRTRGNGRAVAPRTPSLGRFFWRTNEVGEGTPHGPMSVVLLTKVAAHDWSVPQGCEKFCGKQGRSMATVTVAKAYFARAPPWPDPGGREERTEIFESVRCGSAYHDVIDPEHGWPAGGPVIAVVESRRFEGLRMMFMRTAAQKTTRGHGWSPSLVARKALSGGWRPWFAAVFATVAAKRPTSIDQQLTTAANCLGPVWCAWLA